MEKEDLFQKHSTDTNEHDPRIIGRKFYRNPIKVCDDIDEVIVKAISTNLKKPKALLQLINNIITLNDSVRALFYIEERNPDVNVNPNDLIELSKNIKFLIENEEFWKLYTDYDSQDDDIHSSRKYNPALAAKNKEELKKVLGGFVNFLNYFALKNYSPRRNKH